MELTDEEGLALLLKASVKTALGAGGSGETLTVGELTGTVGIFEETMEPSIPI